MGFVLHDVPHIRQKESWDCGLACTWMALRALTEGLETMEAARTFQKICDQQGFDTSVWTIDLAYLLVRYGIVHQFSTETFGVDPSYEDQPYYQNDFKSVTHRINSLFRKAKESGVNIQKRFVTLQQLYDHISDNGIAIVLVDTNVIKCHYIVVCGYDKKTEHILYKDPAQTEELSALTASTFEAARTAHGTDCDIILLKLRKDNISQ